MLTYSTDDRVLALVLLHKIIGVFNLVCQQDFAKWLVMSHIADKAVTWGSLFHYLSTRFSLSLLSPVPLSIHWFIPSSVSPFIYMTSPCIDCRTHKTFSQTFFFQDFELLGGGQFVMICTRRLICHFLWSPAQLFSHLQTTLSSVIISWQKRYSVFQ